MKSILECAKRNDEYICLYSDKDDISCFMFGKVNQVDDERFCLNLVSPDGHYDGMFIGGIREIYRIDTGGQYARKMANLIENDFSDAYECMNGTNIMEEALDVAIDTQKPISIELDGSGQSDIHGLVELRGDETYKIRLIDEYGQDDGFSYIRAEDISSMTIDGVEERRFFKLWQMRL